MISNNVLNNNVNKSSLYYPIPFFQFSGSEQEELHYRYALTVIHGKSEYTYKGPVISMVKSCQDIKNEGRCLVIREKVWDYMSYKLKITKHWLEKHTHRIASLLMYYYVTIMILCARSFLPKK